MMKIAIASILPYILTCLTGCWVALPSNGLGNSSAYIGKVYTLQRDIYVCKGSFHSWATEIEPEKRMMRVVDPHVILKKGIQIKIISIVSRRGEMGVLYYYRCRNLDGNETFELVFDMGDCLGLPNTSV